MLKIAQLGQPVLRQVAAPLSPEEIAAPAFQQLLADMKETLLGSGGVGLAAPQVFVPRRVFLGAVLLPPGTDDKPEIEVFVNPQVTELGPDRAEAWEGCLSFPELLVLVPRIRSVRIDYLDALAQPRSLILHGFPARIVQHELDHLNGVLTLDRAASTRDIVKTSEIDDVLDSRE